jgi:hypothetical protein
MGRGQAEPVWIERNDLENKKTRLYISACRIYPVFKTVPLLTIFSFSDPRDDSQDALPCVRCGKKTIIWLTEDAVAGLTMKEKDWTPQKIAKFG